MRAMRTVLAAAVVLVLLAGCGDGDEQAAQRPPALERTPWILASGLDATDWQEVAPSATFKGGTLSGSSGCNRYSTSYAVNGDALKLGTPAGTKMACGMPGDKVEAAFIAALSRVARFTATDEELTLRDVDGNELLVFHAASPTGDWKVTSFLQRDAVTGPLDGSRITASFHEGTLSGTTGCNRYTAAYTLDDGGLQIAPPVVTRSKCVRPGLMEQEQRYLAALATAAGFSVEGSSLTLLTATGTIAATYTRTS